MANITRTPISNTELFASLPESVAVIINDVIHAAYLFLGWHQASKWLLTEILSRLAENKSFELGHDDFCGALWPYLSLNRRREKFSRWLAKLKKDMELSLFFAVNIPKQVISRTEAGGFRGNVTVYEVGRFWELFKCVQFVARKCDLLAMPPNRRRAEIRKIVAGALKEMGAVQIVHVNKEKKEKSEKEKTPSFPCKCGCVDCLRCLKKRVLYATASEADGARPAEGRVDRASVAKRIAAAFDDVLFECGQDWMNLGMSLGSFALQLDKECEQTEHRLREAMVRANKSKIRLVGG